MYNNTQVGKVKYTEMRSYMFEVNEKVVYGVVGVCEIEQIGLYMTLKVLYIRQLRITKL